MNFNKVIFEKSAGIGGQFPDDGLPEVVFSGKSNVGKSSLINKFFGKKNLARSSKKPGKTKCINFFECEGVRFADLPGYGFAEVSKSEKARWAQLLEDYFSTGRNISLVVQILDSRHPPTTLDFKMLEFLKKNRAPFIIVTSKIDKLSKTERENREENFLTELKKYKNSVRIAFSAATGEGLESIRTAVLASLGVVSENG